MEFLIAAISTDAVKVIDPLLKILMALLAIAVTVLVLMQDGNTTNITGLGGSNNEKMFNKGATKTKEAKLKLWTVILSACLVVVSVLYFIFKS